MPDRHPIIALFESRAQAHDAAGSKVTLDDAMVMLARWMELAQGRLSEDDVVVLLEVGAIMFRNGLTRRADMKKPH
ncbi:hypothetical protein H0A66_16010 [Alcaligenaceae bacterium]|nr:hypothetical protein [Alcaligenaceae bacterium]